MKRLLSLLTIGILFYACSENPSPVDPVDQHTAAASLTTYTEDTNLTWLTVPSTKASSFVLDQEAVSGVKEIDLSVGGNVSVYYVSRDGKRTISANLSVPPKALKDRRSLKFYMTVDNVKLSIRFEPHPTNFDIPLSLDLEFTGIDLRGIDVSKIYFAYLDKPFPASSLTDSRFGISNTPIYSDLRTGTLRVRGASIPHFSEYGFVRKDNPENP